MDIINSSEFLLLNIILLNIPGGFPGGASGKEPACQCRRVHPWFRKIPQRREWLPTPVFLPGKFHRQRNLVGYKSWGRKDLDMPEPPDWHFHINIWGLASPGLRKLFFFFRERSDDTFFFWLCRWKICYNQSVLPWQHKISLRQHIIEMPWLWSNKTLFKKAGTEQIWPLHQGCQLLV